ncbi:acyl-CoA dehydrogenase [Benzoatithermus flavus]|uniref:Acyl-CoA dehydrogenase n=1 Tax=Benzoatithermus flavus TaxID=3108223 RepID=A0ABU8XQ55_9PROT
MTAYNAPIADMRFVFEHVAGLREVAALPGLDHASPDVVDAVLEEAGRLAANVLAPLNRTGDVEGAVLENGVVRTARGFKEAYRQFAEGGWMGLVFPEAYGGQNLPWLVNAAVSEMWNAANLSFQLCPLLTQGAIEAILHHGTDEQREIYATRLVSGAWSGAMCLTEPQAGSDVGAVRTRAVRDGDRYRLFGTKIFITYGEHDLTENIVHLVLARLDGAPAGTKGLSLFIVPKYLPNPDGSLGARNDMRCVSIEHKLGINASPTCVMSYGDEEGAVGFLLGQENEGMRCMFTMMNNARLAVGNEGLGLAERAYQEALAYAQQRVQGRHQGRPAAIIAYPDVRRMLFTMRARIAAMRALCYWTAGFVDRSYRAPDATARSLAADRVALLTPMVKAWCTDLAQEIASTAVQVHGGMGFIEETGVAQYYRDAKILSIYEGTNGIQALDLAGRKLSLAGGELPWRLLEELGTELPSLPAELVPALRPALEAVERATRHLQASSDEDRAAGATPYLHLFSATLGGFLLARGAAAAATTDAAGKDWPVLARFYVQHLLPPALALEQAVVAGVGTLDPDILAA